MINFIKLMIENEFIKIIFLSFNMICIMEVILNNSEKVTCIVTLSSNFIESLFV